VDHADIRGLVTARYLVFIVDICNWRYAGLLPIAEKQSTKDKGRITLALPFCCISNLNP
jgi:hypothetical protein